MKTKTYKTPAKKTEYSLVPVQIGPMYNPNDGTGVKPTEKAQMILKRHENGSFYPAGTVAYNRRTREWLIWNEIGHLWGSYGETREKALTGYFDQGGICYDVSADNKVAARLTPPCVVN